MSTTYHLACCFSLFLCMCCNLAMAEVAIDHNSTRSNRGTTVGGGGDATDSELAMGNDKIVRKKPGRTTYANVTLSAVGEAEAIEYGLIAALMNGDDDAMIEYALIVALLTEMEPAATGDCNDSYKQVKPSLAAGDGDLGGGNGNAGSGTLRNNDPIPGIDVIVDKDPVLNESLNNSPVMMLNDMLRAGYSQAEVVEFALATGLLGP